MSSSRRTPKPECPTLPLCGTEDIPRRLQDDGIVNQSTASDGGDVEQNFWQSQLGGSHASTFPATPTTWQKPNPSYSVHYDTFVLPESRRCTSAEIIVRAAWAILHACYTTCDDLVFGVNPTGSRLFRDRDVDIAGLNVETLPFRVVIDWSQDVEWLLSQIELQGTSLLQYMHSRQERPSQRSQPTDRTYSVGTIVSVSDHTHASSPGVASDNITSDSPADPISSTSGTSCALELDVHAQVGGMQISLACDPAILSARQCERLARQMECLVGQLFAAEQAHVPLSHICAAGEADKREIWEWNSTIHKVPGVCVHDLLQERVQLHPSALAVDAWDGQLSYRKLDTYASALGTYVARQGLQRATIVPLLFEKSMWSTVAILAVMKAGATVALLDVFQPERRLKQMVDQIAPHFVLTSATQGELAARLTAAPSFQVHLESIQDLDDSGSPSKVCLPEVDPNSTLCLVFTSGSTGTPKAAMLSHNNMASALMYQGMSHRVDTSTRVLDLASNSGDSVWMSTLLALYSGGCLCVPSNETRLGNNMLSLRDFKATWTISTPTMADVIYDINLPTLQTLISGGEPISPSVLAMWQKRGVRVINCYGPAECTPYIALHDLSNDDGRTIGIGKSVGCCTWLLAHEANNTLAAIGAVGELYIEGPIVGQGYLSDVTRTNESFVQGPSWLLEGTTDHQGRRGRVYRTGDLFRYGDDGGLVFVGRKDSRIKLRGQRVELGEIEYHVKVQLGATEGLQVAVESVVPTGRKNERLVAFVKSEVFARWSPSGPRATSKEKTDELRRSLGLSLPSSMVPTDVLLLQTVPTTLSGKIDRKNLRELAAAQLASPLAFRERKPTTVNKAS